MSALLTALTLVLVIGDSLSSTECAWPRALDQALPSVHVQVDARPGRLWVHYDVPRDLRAGVGEIVLVWLGGNDLGSGQPLRLFREKARETVAVLEARGFRVLLALPPAVGWTDAGPYRRVVADLASDTVTVLDPPWGAVESLDGLHPSCAGHAGLAWWYWGELGRLGLL